MDEDRRIYLSPEGSSPLASWQSSLRSTPRSSIDGDVYCNPDSDNEADTESNSHVTIAIDSYDSTERNGSSPTSSTSSSATTVQETKHQQQSLKEKKKQKNKEKEKKYKTAKGKLDEDDDEEKLSNVHTILFFTLIFVGVIIVLTFVLVPTDDKIKNVEENNKKNQQKKMPSPQPLRGGNNNFNPSMLKNSNQAHVFKWCGSPQVKDYMIFVPELLSSSNNNGIYESPQQKCRIRMIDMRNEMTEFGKEIFDQPFKFLCVNKTNCYVIYENGVVTVFTPDEAITTKYCDRIHDAALFNTPKHRLALSCFNTSMRLEHIVFIDKENQPAIWPHSSRGFLPIGRNPLDESNFIMRFLDPDIFGYNSKDKGLFYILTGTNKQSLKLFDQDLNSRVIIESRLPFQNISFHHLNDDNVKDLIVVDGKSIIKYDGKTLDVMSTYQLENDDEDRVFLMLPADIIKLRDVKSPQPSSSSLLSSPTTNQICKHQLDLMNPQDNKYNLLTPLSTLPRHILYTKQSTKMLVWLKNINNSLCASEVTNGPQNSKTVAPNQNEIIQFQLEDSKRSANTPTDNPYVKPDTATTRSTILNQPRIKKREYNPLYENTYQNQPMNELQSNQKRYSLPVVPRGFKDGREVVASNKNIVNDVNNQEREENEPSEYFRLSTYINTLQQQLLNGIKAAVILFSGQMNGPNISPHTNYRGYEQTKYSQGFDGQYQQQQVPSVETERKQNDVQHKRSMTVKRQLKEVPNTLNKRQVEGKYDRGNIRYKSAIPGNNNQYPAMSNWGNILNSESSWRKAYFNVINVPILRDRLIAELPTNANVERGQRNLQQNPPSSRYGRSRRSLQTRCENENNNKDTKWFLTVVTLDQKNPRETIVGR